MKQILTSIGILLLLIIFSISDFDFPSTPKINADRHECVEYELYDQVMVGSDGACVAASMEMLLMMDRYRVDCLLITNTGWIPATLNPVTRHWVNWSLSNDAVYRKKGKEDAMT
jgi:hypothetical protein